MVGADLLAGELGADTARLFVLFAAPPEKEVDWRREGAEGVYRFLGRVYRFATRNLGGAGGSGESDRKVLRKLHQTVKKITEDFETRWHFNTCIASIMELVNVLYAEEANISAAAMPEIIEKLALMLRHSRRTSRRRSGRNWARKARYSASPWPSFDPELAKEDEAEVVVQVNGKLRGPYCGGIRTSKDELETRARADEKVAAMLDGKQIVEDDRGAG
ncbi:MAG: class I tRNA ligase family protein [Ignavibacteriota bacterium]